MLRRTLRRLPALLALERPLQDPEDLRATPALNAMARFVLLAMVVWSAAGLVLFAKPGPSLAFNLGLCLILVAVFWLIRRRSERAAAVLFVGGAWGLATAFLVFAGGVTTGAVTMYVFLSELACLLLGVRFGLLVVILSSAAGAAQLILERYGLGPPRLFPVPPQAAWLDVTVALFMIVIPLHIVLNDLRGALAAARVQLVERRKAEKALQESRNRLLEIAKNVPGAIFQFRVGGDGAPRSTYIGRGMDELFGLPADVALPSPEFAARLPAAEREALRDSLQRAIAERSDWRYEGRLQSNGDDHWFQVVSSPTAVDGELVYNGILLDISERKTAEAKALHLEAQFRQAQKMEAVGRLAGGVAHDFNNLLTCIIGYVSLAKATTAGSDPLAHTLNEISRAAESAAGLTKRLLLFSRKQMVNPRSINLGTMLSGLHPLLGRLIGEDVTLTMKSEPGLWLVRLDPGELEQVIINLAVNARDAMPNGGRLVLEAKNVTLEEGHSRGLLAGDYVALAVSDSGHGMSEEVKAHIFEPFFTTKEDGKGTGLGLAIVYGIVTQSHGRVDVYSEVGVGTTFRLYLPRVNVADEASVGATAPKITRGNETVLLVEDEQPVRDLETKILEWLGYRVVVCRSGAEAIEAARQHGGAIDLLLTDVVMPTMNGRLLADEVTKIIPGIKILFTSGYSADIISHHGILDPGIHFISKPFTPATLSRKIREVLDTDVARPQL